LSPHTVKNHVHNILTRLLCFAISDFGVILSGPIRLTT
jgi:hypothetical protein